MRRVTTENQQYMGDWLVRIMNHPLPIETVCIGQELDGNLVGYAGKRHSRMYVNILGRTYLLSRVLYFYHYNEDPEPPS